VALAAAEAVGPDGSGLAVDLSVDQLDVTAARAAALGLTNLAVRVADASVDELGDPADVLVSRFGVMFFDDPTAAFTHLHAALRPGGRAAFVCWQADERNPWTHLVREAVAEVLPLPESPPGAPGPFAFAEPDHVRGVLTRAGFAEVDVEDLRRPVHLGDSVDEALDFIATTDWVRAAFADAPQDRVDEALARVRAVVTSATGDAGHIDLPGAAWLVHARA
jgi:SAM-dependent methyltransferase